MTLRLAISKKEFQALKRCPYISVYQFACILNDLSPNRVREAIISRDLNDISEDDKNELIDALSSIRPTIQAISTQMANDEDIPF